MGEDYYGREDIVVDGKGLYTRLELRHKVSGTREPVSSKPAAVRRVWPSEPNVGWITEKMSFKVDGALTVGGPTLKTYTLNNDREISDVREARIIMDDTYRKLRASEDQIGMGDMLNVLGSWTSLQTTAAGALTFDTEVSTDARTYLWNGTTTIALLRKGTYDISYRAFATPSAGALRVDLTVGSGSNQWRCSGGPTTTTIADLYTYVKTTDASENVTLSLNTGTSLGSGTFRSELKILKVR